MEIVIKCLSKLAKCLIDKMFNFQVPSEASNSELGSTEIFPEGSANTSYTIESVSAL